jgi:hypothetical protein
MDDWVDSMLETVVTGFVIILVITSPAWAPFYFLWRAIRTRSERIRDER